MFARGVQQRITHAVVFDEAHRAARLKLSAQMAKECRKYGLAMLAASQEIKDFDESLIQSIATYLVLRVGEGDAKLLARYMAPVDTAKIIADKLKTLPRYEGYFFTEGYKTGRRVHLQNPFAAVDGV